MTSPTDFSQKFLWLFFFPIHATCPAHIKLLHLVALTMMTIITIFIIIIIIIIIIFIGAGKGLNHHSGNHLPG
jgi:heme/copper-type cytochrome/quinol oxidase subunit 2